MVFMLSFLVFPGVAPYGLTFKHTLGGLSFPGATQQDQDDWWATILLLVFNLCDTAGRTLPAFFIAFKGYGLLAATLARSVFVVLLVGCANSWAPGLNDVAALLIMVFFAVTNGYFASMSMMAGPQAVAPKDRQAGGFLMSLFLQAGILAGSLAAFGFKPPST
jgi:hypothetical protein